MKTYYVYLLANSRLTVFYTGVTNNLSRRMSEHKSRLNKRSFTSRYNCNKLMYFEEFNDIRKAISREKQLKKYHRQWKIELIERFNPEWVDLSKEWCGVS